jgi:hypothetical protein
MKKKFTTYFIRSLSVLFLLSSLLFSFIHASWNPIWSDGDELHYLIMTQSFLEDGDFVLGDDYDDKVYFEHHGVVVKNEHTIISPIDGAERAWHDIGISVLMSPGYSINGIDGARISLWILNTLLLLIVYAYAWIKLFKIPTSVGLFSLGLIVLSSPVLLYSQYGFADMFAGILWLLSTILLYEFITKDKPTRFQFIMPILASTALGLGVFVHHKLFLSFFLSFGVFALLIVWKEYCVDRSIASLLRNSKIWTIAAASGLPFMVFVLLKSYLMFRWYGIFNPNAAYQLVLEQKTLRDEFNPPLHLAGLLFDTGKGILMSMPILIPILSGIVSVFRSNKHIFFMFIVPPVVYSIIQSLYPVWFSWGPNTRYAIIPVMVLASILPIVVLFVNKHMLGKLGIAIVCIWTLLISYSIFPIRKGGYPSFVEVSPTYTWLDTVIPFFPNQKWFYIDLFNSPSRFDYIGVIIAISILIVLSIVIELLRKNKITWLRGKAL